MWLAITGTRQAKVESTTSTQKCRHTLSSMRCLPIRQRQDSSTQELALTGPSSSGQRNLLRRWSWQPLIQWWRTNFGSLCAKAMPPSWTPWVPRVLTTHAQHLTDPPWKKTLLWTAPALHEGASMNLPGEESSRPPCTHWELLDIKEPEALGKGPKAKRLQMRQPVSAGQLAAYLNCTVKMYKDVRKQSIRCDTVE